MCSAFWEWATRKQFHWECVQTYFSIIGKALSFLMKGLWMCERFTLNWGVPSLTTVTKTNVAQTSDDHETAGQAQVTADYRCVYSKWRRR